MTWLEWEERLVGRASESFSWGIAPLLLVVGVRAQGGCAMLVHAAACCKAKETFTRTRLVLKLSGETLQESQSLWFDCVRDEIHVLVTFMYKEEQGLETTDHGPTSPENNVGHASATSSVWLNHTDPALTFNPFPVPLQHVSVAHRPQSI